MDVQGGMRRRLIAIATAIALCSVAQAVWAKDLGDILVEKGLITPDELREAKEEE